MGTRPSFEYCPRCQSSRPIIEMDEDGVSARRCQTWAQYGALKRKQIDELRFHRRPLLDRLNLFLMFVVCVLCLFSHSCSLPHSA